MAKLVLPSTKFAGCSVVKVQSNAGFQEQISNLQLELVEDPSDGDAFTYPEPGTPMSYTFGGMKFDGLLQHRGRDRNVSSGETFSVILYSPTEVLENIQLIMDNYRGVNTLCPNLLNVFGYLEGGGDTFGGSGKNASGIPWWRVKAAIGAIQWGTTDFSPGIWLKGHQYVVDVDSMPATPDFYRVGGGAFFNMNDIIRKVFQDAGYDYIVCLEMGKGFGPHRIYFKSQSKLVQPPIGQIDEIISSADNINSGQSSVEFRNDVTCGVILGGDVEAAYPMTDNGSGDVIHQFWGFQFSNSLIPFGVRGNPPLVESTNNGNFTLVGLNATPIADIIGGFTYVCTIYEMRFAMYSFESWTCFILRKRPELAQMLGLGDIFPSIFGNEPYDMNPQSFYATTPDGVKAFTSMYQQDPVIIPIIKIWDFVRKQGEEHLGRQFMVRIPFQLKYAFEEETNNLNFNNSVNTEGYWPDYLGGFSTGPLGLFYENFNRFMNDNGKFTTFVKFSSPDLWMANIADLNPSTTLIQGNEIFMQCSVEPNIYFSPAPSVRITLSEPVWSRSLDTIGGIDDIAWLLDIDPENLTSILQMNNGEFPIGIHPGAFGPTGAVVCLKSNEYTYGPWVKLGVAGKVSISQDTELVPWNYGGFELMNQAAVAQLADISTSRQLEAGGTKSSPGAPNISLGDALDLVGPIVTSIDVSVDGNNGVMTTYRMRSQTPVSGAFSKQNADRLRRLGTSAQETRRLMRSVMERSRDNRIIVNNATRAFNDRIAASIAQRNTNAVLQAIAILDPDTGIVRHQIAAKTHGASVVGQNLDNGDRFKNTATVGIDGLFRPFTTDVNADDTSALPKYETPVSGAVITNDDLNPYKTNTDIQWVASGDTPENFKGHYTGRGTLDHSKMRPLGIKGPVSITAWGYDIQGNPVPNSNTSSSAKLQDMSASFLTDYLKKSNKWKVGQLDIRWNSFNKTWISLGACIPGKYIGGTNNQVEIDGFPGHYLKIANPNFLGDSSQLINKNVVCGFNPIKNTWLIISAGC